MSVVDRLRISEIFYSLQGETATVGLPTVFVRLTGCPLRCQYCDTAYAFKGGSYYKLPEILTEVARYKTRHITVTGGEPLAQPACLALMRALCDLNYMVSLETSGALPIDQVDSRVVKVMDLKTPGSDECERNMMQNLSHITPQDHIKFVICHRADYEWSKQLCEQYGLWSQCEVLFSPSYQQLDNHELAQWILQDQLSVRFQIQQHKYIWGDRPGC